MKQVIYFEDHDYYEHMNSLIEKLESHDIKVIDIIIGSKAKKVGSKVTHTLIVEAPYFLKVEIDYDYEHIAEMRGGTIKLKGGDIIEF